jgi:small subunit ribosomal protein S14
MAKRSMIERELKRSKLVQKYKNKRKQLLEEFLNSSNYEEKLIIHSKLQQLPRNSAQVRLRNRCWRTGRPRGFYKDFGLSRNMLREMGHQGILPGLVKSSW